jgi:hypothetical protein
VTWRDLTCNNAPFLSLCIVYAFPFLFSSALPLSPSLSLSQADLTLATVSDCVKLLQGDFLPAALYRLTGLGQVTETAADPSEPAEKKASDGMIWKVSVII